MAKLRTCEQQCVYSASGFFSLITDRAPLLAPAIADVHHMIAHAYPVFQGHACRGGLRWILQSSYQSHSADEESSGRPP